jgi:Family of unknown function (DUF5313)
MVEEQSGTESPPEPTGRTRFLYYLFGATPPAEYAEWVRQDIQTDAWLWRRLGQAVISIAIGFPVVMILVDASVWSLVGLLIGVGIGALFELTFSGSWSRKRAIRYYEKRWERKQAASRRAR